MLDTDTCSYIMKRSHPLVLKRLQSFSVEDACMSVVTKAELLYGVEVSPRHAHDAAALAAFLPYVEAVDFDEGTALHYAEIRADVKRRGVMIGANDLFIAAHARALGLTLVTNNTAEFERVRDLKLEFLLPPDPPAAFTPAATPVGRAAGTPSRSPRGESSPLVRAPAWRPSTTRPGVHFPRVQDPALSRTRRCC